MKVAIIHDYLNQYGGAERVLESLLQIFPHAHLYTLLTDRGVVADRFSMYLRGTSFLNMPFVAKHHRPFIPLMPTAMSLLRLKESYDLVFSATAGFAKGVRVPSGTFHLSYCYTPLRYAWERGTYFPNPLMRTLGKPFLEDLRRWDFAAAQKPQAMIASSEFIREKIRAYYGRDTDVVYPPVNHKTFYFTAKTAPKPKESGYHLAAGRLLQYKRFDLVVRAFRNLELPLKIVGVGKERARLERMARGKANIEFLSFVSDDELRKLYAGAHAFIFPQVEDFGLVAAEAQSCGTPIVAFRGGAALEIIEEGKTGVFFDEQNPTSLIRAVQAARDIRFNRAYIARQAKRFSFTAFKKGLFAHIPKEIRNR